MLATPNMLALSPLSFLAHQAAPLNRPLIALHTGVLLEYAATSKVIDENTVATLLLAALDPLQQSSKHSHSRPIS